MALATGDIEEAKKYCTEARERAEKSGPSQAQLLQKASVLHTLQNLFFANKIIFAKYTKNIKEYQSKVVLLLYLHLI